MLRLLHRWPGLLALALVTLLALTGGALSVFPAAERLTAPQADPGLSVATLASRVQQSHPGVEQIRRAPSGRITAYWFDDGIPGSAVVDPASGADVAAADPNQSERWLTDLHRSLFLGDSGRWVAAAGAFAILLLACSGAGLIARRTGGWRHWFAPVRGGSLAGRLHVEFGRAAVLALAFSAATALWMTASTLDFLPDQAARPAFPAAVSGAVSLPLQQIDALARTPIGNLRELSLPVRGDASDLFTLKTAGGIGYIDQGTGQLLSWDDNSLWWRISEAVYTLHTGRGAATLGLVLGLMALSVPVLGLSGLLLWLDGWRSRTRLRGNAAAGAAETIILVGSEGGTTWGFAATLHETLRASGQTVHTAAMTTFDPRRYGQARQILILAATYGNGVAPASAKGFLDRLQSLEQAPEARFAILGFGDRGFPDFCGYARQLRDMALARGWPELLPFDTVDRQSPQEFARWGHSLGQALGADLELLHQTVAPKTQALTLLSRRDFGTAVQAPTAILRFALPRLPLWQRLLGRNRFEAGDLLAVVPEGSNLPRHYSLASGDSDGFLEIAVRHQPGGLCSGQLTALEPGDRIHAFVRANPGFHAPRGRAPLILIGAGCGVAPLAGMVRANARRRPVQLFFGIRDRMSDFLFVEELQQWQEDGRLAGLHVATSRGSRPHHVQDAIRREATELMRLASAGAHILVCGGRDMAAGVAEALTEILAQVELDLAQMKLEGRYAEDVF